MNLLYSNKIIAFTSLMFSTLFVANTSYAQRPSRIVSPNGQYEATLIPVGSKGLHYEVRNIGTGRVIFSTREQRGRTQNDVKGGKFSANSSNFAAAYHYGHKGKYTWVGVWNVANGQKVSGTEISGFVRDIPTSVFPKTQDGIWWAVTCSCIDPYRTAALKIRTCMVHSGGSDLSCGLLANQVGGGTKCRAVGAEVLDRSPCNPFAGNFSLMSSRHNNENNSFACMNKEIIETETLSFLHKKNDREIFQAKDTNLSLSSFIF